MLHIRPINSNMFTPPEMRYERERLDTVPAIYAGDMPGTRRAKDRKYQRDRLAKYPGISKNRVDVSEESAQRHKDYKEFEESRDAAEAEYCSVLEEERERMTRDYTPESRNKYDFPDRLDSRGHHRLGLLANEGYEANVRFVFFCRHFAVCRLTSLQAYSGKKSPPSWSGV